MRRAAAIAAYLAAMLAVDTQVGLGGQLLLGALTWIVLFLAVRTLAAERRAQVAVVVCAATLAEVTGSILWGVYSYRLHNLPVFVPPAHGLVFLAGLALAQAMRRHSRALVWLAAGSATAWGLLGLTVLPRTDAAGALGVPLLVVFLWRSPAQAAYAGVFLVVAGLELYGTAIGTWSWARALPGLGIPDGNPPSGVASGYVWFDVMALLLAPRLLAFLRAARRSAARERRPRGASGPPVGGCGLRLPTILHAQDPGAAGILHFPRPGEVKHPDEPPEGGGINRDPWTTLLCVAPVLNSPHCGGAGPQNCGGAGTFERDGTDAAGSVPLFVLGAGLLGQGEAETGATLLRRAERDPPERSDRHDQLLGLRVVVARVNAQGQEA